ncbi:thiopeptide-type bacteriocin biosynthesis protein [Chryseobacterium chendengshani]|uniref:thiopeptide-type bacteriocin biosynthesis protein n=1 Tax=Chryseobacterium sp. LJ668 TaxID=2864040 RepID=UPI001C68E180|nr:thiopeptide-type bacteriocin biosynthesis protein [Chryseobacterium sp. LJ668]MBW8522964.1 thiopeptide-type bacteriocin biosynthesis protein [Chryseobacterium sp. LJ668]QYK16493.1 thiopeptide-type bacteriocin biosynthesis protein [Chryseobacterium sp. LJ668]
MKGKYTPGSEWIYLKFYMSISFADEILTNYIFKIIKHAEKENQIEKFFFIRYSDPYYHIRLRIKLKNQDSISLILNLFQARLKKYLENDIIWKIQMDTYEQEIERYHAKLIDVTESLFCIDSEYCIKILKIINEHEIEDYKWKISLKSIDSYLSLFFGNNLEEKLKSISTISDSFKHEFGYNKNNSKVLNELYRDKRKFVEEIIDESELLLNNDPIIRKIITLSKKRDSELKKVVGTLKDICLKEKINFEDYIFSYIHMNINRIIPTNNRAHELLLYDYVRRFYESKIAKNKYIALTHKN